MEATLRLQEELGLDILVDGQMDRGDAVGFFAEHLEGMEPAGLVRCFGNRYYRKPRIVGELSRPGPLTVDRFKLARSLTERPLLAVLTGPYTLMDWSFDEHYPSRADACRALAEVIREEAQDLLAAGAAEILIDEPAISVRPAEMELVHEGLARVAGSLRGKARVWTHICYGDLAPVLEAVFALPVDGIILEQANSGFPLLDALGDLPRDKMLGLGVIDVHSTRTEPADEIRERVARLLDAVPEDRLCLTPDDGMRTLTADQARSKLEQMVAAAITSS